MANTSLKIGGNNWAVKEDNLLGYNVIQNKYVPIEIDTVRATTATRVNENGLIEVVPRNLLTYSEQFNNVAWGKYQASVTANTTTAPNGTLTADTLTDDNSTTTHITYQLININAGVYTISVYAKANTLSNISLQLFDGVGSSYLSNAFNLSSGTTTGANQSIENVGNGWYRCSFTLTTTISGVQWFYVLLNNGTSSFYVGTGSGSVFIWGYQAVQGNSATDYFPTTDRLNIPRIDYSSGEASLLVEGQRTNLVTYSSDASQWLYSTFVDLTINDTTSPDGTLSADKFQFTDNGSIRPGNVQFTFTNNYCFSVFIKKGNSRYITLTASFFTTPTTVGFDLDTQTAQSGGIIESFNDGWFRLSISNNVTGDADKTGVFYIYLPNSLGGTTSIIGNNAYVWGAQAEEGSYATSYIPTVASTVTRNQDVISKTGISDLINSVEGVLYFEMGVLSNDLTRRVITITDGTTNKL